MKKKSHLHTPQKYLSKKKSQLLLHIFREIKNGKNPAKIIKNSKYSRDQIYNNLKILKDTGLIKKVGYGTWEAKGSEKKLKKKLKEVAFTYHVGRPHTPQKYKNFSVRGHAISVTLRIPELRNWEKREHLLRKNKINFKKIPQGQRIILDNAKVWLCDTSIVMYFKDSWFGYSVDDVHRRILADVFKFITRLENFLRISTLKIAGRYKMKFSRRHYALIENELARQYDKEKKKLYVYDKEGLWFLIDNSYNLHEAEGVRAKTTVTDTKKVEDFFNGLKETPITPQFVVNGFHNLIEDRKYYAKNLKAHVGSIRRLAHEVENLSKQVKKINGGN